MSDAELVRAWVPTDDHAAAGFTLLQWNVLADGLAHGSFLRAPKESLAWGSRSERILSGIERSGLGALPDVLCLQEVDHYTEFFEPRLSALGYAGTYVPKEPGRDGLCLLHRAERFSAERTQTVRYRDPASGAEQTQLGLLARLTPRAGGPTLCVATTHLKAKPGFEERRGAQVAQLLAALDPDTPLVVAGDFNDVPGSPAHQVAAESPLGLRSAYATLNGGPEPAWTTWKVRAAGEVQRTIDYVWYSVAHLTPIGHLAIPTNEAVAKARLPSWQYPSDHLKLVVRFSVR